VQALLPARLQRGEFSSTDSVAEPSLTLPAAAAVSFQPTNSVEPDKVVSSGELNKEVSSVKSDFKKLNSVEPSKEVRSGRL